MSKLFSHEKCLIIAEGGSNHEGNFSMVKKMIEAAARAKADVIKFQSFTKDTLFAEDEYTKLLNLPKGALNGIKEIAFKDDWYKKCALEAEKRGISFVSTPFSVEAVDMLESCGVSMYKVASCDITHIQLLKRIAKTRKSVVLSTGLGRSKDIKRALDILSTCEIALLHCVVEYPPATENLNLRYIGTLGKKYSVISGFSDHTPNTQTPMLAVAMGARIVEKHFTLTPNAEGFDHSISVDEMGLKAIREGVDFTLKALGEPKKIFSEKEKKELIYARRGIFLKRDMKKGQIIKEDDIAALRPVTAISAEYWEEVLGKKLQKDAMAFSPLKRNMIL